MKKIFSEIIVRESTKLSEAIGLMDKSGLRIVLVCSSRGRLKGILSYGDARRAILNGTSLGSSITSIYNKNPIIAKKGTDQSVIKKLALSKRRVVGGSISIPVINEKGIVVDLAFVDRKNQLGFISKTNVFADRAIEKILVTGGAGYLGSVLVRHLLSTGYQVRVLDNLTYGKDSLAGVLANRNFDLFVGDILNIEDVVSATRNVDAVIHLAAIVGDEASNNDPLKTISDNTLATVNLANVCRRLQVNRFIFASTCSVYGASHPRKILTENSPLLPVSLYAQSKIDCEIELKKLSDRNFAPTILRFSTLYGWSYRMRFDLVVNLFCALAHYKKELTVFGGDQWRPFIHVGDAANAISRVLESPLPLVSGKAYNVGSNNGNYTIAQIASMVRKVFGDIKINKDNSIKDLRNYYVSFSKIMKELGFIPNKTVEDGILEIFKNMKKSNSKILSRNTFNSPTFSKILQ